MSGFEIVGLLLAMPGIVQVFFQTGEKLHEKMKKNKKMNDYARDLSKFIIDDGRAQLSRDFELARGVLKDQSTRTDEKERINRLFSGALAQLQHMSDLANVVLSSEVLDFRKRSAALRDIKDKITDIRTSMSEFHQLVISLHTIAISESSLLLEDQDFVLTGAERDCHALNDIIFLARGQVSRSLSSASSGDGRFILESKPYTTRSIKSVKRDLRILSQKLAAADQQSGILPLVGFRDNPSRNEFQLVFGIPSGGGSMQTLGSIYGKPRPSLNFRIHLCGQLAEAVLQTHKLGLVHKHIRPENVLLFSMPHEIITDEPFPTTFLSGWQYARTDGGVTRLVGESLWERAIYQHPERQSEHVEDEYCMGHDIYSLGVCMLEILTWDPLVITNGEGDLQEKSISQSYRASFNMCLHGQGTQEEPMDVEWLVQDSEMIQRTLLSMAQTLIPAAAGKRMRDLVSQCLTCLDGEAKTFRVSQEREDKDVAVGFVDTVLKDIRWVMNAI